MSCCSHTVHKFDLFFLSQTSSAGQQYRLHDASLLDVVNVDHIGIYRHHYINHTETFLYSSGHFEMIIMQRQQLGKCLAAQQRLQLLVPLLLDPPHPPGQDPKPPAHPSPQQGRPQMPLAAPTACMQQMGMVGMMLMATVQMFR